MRKLFLLILSFFLVACDGFDINSDDNLSEDSTDRIFTRPELAFNILYSSIVLNDSGFSNARDGFVVLFTNTSELIQIEFRSDNNDDALVGNYPWTISNDDLQVTYPNGVVCTTNKTSETASQYTTTSSCSGGEPRNDRIRNTLNFPNTLNENSFDGRRITIKNDDQDQQIEFFTSGSYEITNLDSDGDVISGTAQSGEFFDNSDSRTFLNDVVILVNSVTNSMTMLILLDGSLSDGTLLSLQFSAETNGELEDVRIYNINENNQWETDSQYDSITVDN